MPERTTKAVVRVSMDCRACSEQCVTEYTGIASLSSQLCLNQLDEKKTNTGCGIVNTLNGLWKSKRCESASLVLCIRVRACVAQLVICDAPSTSVEIDQATVLCWTQGHQRRSNHIFVHFDSCHYRHRRVLFVECNHRDQRYPRANPSLILTLNLSK